MCPVRLFELYLSKLPPCMEELWLKPKKKVRVDDQLWYDKQVVGPHPLENFMKYISTAAGLSTQYTNHCIRSTVITNLDSMGFEARHITAVSGHKSENTIKSYSTKCPTSKKRQMSDALSSVLGEIPVPQSPKKPKITATSTVSKAPQSPVPAAAFPTINNLDLVDWIPIENNAEDFDLVQIIDEVEKENKQITNVTKSDSVTTPSNQTLVQNFTSTNTNAMNQYPFLPKMFFPNSNVTINYNFNNKN